MPARVSQTVPLTPGLDAFVDGEAAASGERKAAARAIRAALRVLQPRRRVGTTASPPEGFPGSAVRGGAGATEAVVL